MPHAGGVEGIDGRQRWVHGVPGTAPVAVDWQTLERVRVACKDCEAERGKEKQEGASSDAVAVASHLPGAHGAIGVDLSLQCRRQWGGRQPRHVAVRRGSSLLEVPMAPVGVAAARGLPRPGTGPGSAPGWRSLSGSGRALA